MLGLVNRVAFELFGLPILLVCDHYRIRRDHCYVVKHERGGSCRAQAR